MRALRLMTVFLMFTASSAFARDVVEEWYLYPSFQYFTWEEFIDGRRLLKEDGPLFGFGGGVRFDLYRKSLMLKVNGELFGGDVDYDGQTQPDPDPAVSERPVKTDVIYFGTKAESDVGWRFLVDKGSVEPFAGLGYRWWLRDIQNSTFVTNERPPQVKPVGGYTEYWQSFYTRIGARAAYSFDKDFSLFLEGGGKYPFYNENEVDFPGVGNVTLEPEPRWSGFAEIGARYGKFRPALFYEGFRFGQSPVKSGLLQPKSESDIFGINIGWSFR